jgi:hypothetical protein
MMSKCLAMVPLCILAFSLGAQAAEVRGTIGKIDLDKNELLVEARRPGVRGTTLPLHVDRDTQVLFGRQAGKLSELAPGRRVRVVYETSDKQNVAQVIHVTGARPDVPAGADNELTGTVQRIAPTEREMVLVGPGARGAATETTLTVAEGAPIKRGDQVIKLEDLKPGERLVVRVDKRDGKVTASALEVMAKKDELDLAKLRQYLKMADQLLQFAQMFGTFKR